MPKKQAKEDRFILEYIKDLNGRQAAIRAGYSPKGAEVQGSLFLSNPNVREKIDKLLAERAKKTGIDAEWLLRRLADEAEADALDLFDNDGNIRPIQEWPLIWRKGLISSMDVETLYDSRGPERSSIGTITKLRISDRVKRLELLGRHVNIQAFRERFEHSGPGGGPIEVQSTDLTKLSDEDLSKLEQLISKATEPTGD